MSPAPPPLVSVVLPTRNPHRGRLEATLAALGEQTLPRAQWELLVVDNGSQPSVTDTFSASLHELAARVLEVPQTGLTPARLAGIRAARGEILVFVDDDNVLARDYLAAAVARLSANPALGAAGGPVQPRWETIPPAWTLEFHGLLALRDHGDQPLIAAGGLGAKWPNFAPVGAGMVVRRKSALRYAEAVDRDQVRHALDRAGDSLASGGDNDLVFTVLHGGDSVGYFPELVVTHLIPSTRLEATYLARLNRGIMRTWVRVLTFHGECPWPPISHVSVPLRVVRAWFRFQAWSGPAARVRWSGARGQFEGLADVSTWPGSRRPNL